MTTFTAAYEAGLAKLGVTAVATGIGTACETCRADLGFETLADLAMAHKSGKVCDEPHFSWSSCECCGSRLGGDRHVAHGLDADAAIVHFDICTDCLVYLANGDEPENWEN